MKMRKEQKPAKLGDLEIQRIHKILESLREEALRSLRRLTNETRSEGSTDESLEDPCTSLSLEDLFQETHRKRVMVRMIEAAMARIQQGIFGICVSCGEEIRRQRLEAVPWSKYCLRCQEAIEKGGQARLRSGLDDGLAILEKAG